MMSSLFLKTLYDKRWFALGWSLGIAFMVYVVLIFFPSLSQGGSFEQIAATLPQQFKGLIGEAASFTQLPNYVATQLYGIRVPLFIMIMALVLAQSLTVSEEERGLLRTLLASPLRRGRVLLEKYAAGLGIFAITALVVTAATYLGLLSIGESVSHQLLWELTLLTFVFAITTFSIPFGVALATGSRALTLVVGITATIGSFLMSSFAAMVDWLEPWDVLSLLHYYDAAAVADSGLNWWHILILAGMSIVFTFVGWLLFRRRDINGN